MSPAFEEMALASLPHEVRRQRLRAVLGEVDIEPLATQGTDFWIDVWARLLKYADHEPDCADACIAVLCDRENRLKVWTYNAEFPTTSRKLTAGRFR